AFGSIRIDIDQAGSVPPNAAIADVGCFNNQILIDFSLNSDTPLPLPRRTARIDVVPDRRRLLTGITLLWILSGIVVREWRRSERDTVFQSHYRLAEARALDGLQRCQSALRRSVGVSGSRIHDTDS